MRIDDINQNSQYDWRQFFVERSLQTQQKLLEHFPSDKNPPDVLFHYTTIDGMRGILDKGTLWFSDSFHMNDHRELLHGRELALESLRERAASSPPPMATLLEKPDEWFNPYSDESYGFRYFVACFCPNGDLLSQWRGYGGTGSGVSLGFDAQALAALVVPGFSERKVFLHKIEYERDAQLEHLRFVEDVCLPLFEEDFAGCVDDRARNVVLTSWRTTLAVHLAGTCARFKHPGFKEEVEWRLSFATLPHERKGRTKFRVRGRELVPYLEIPINSADNAIPVKEFVLAPGGENALRLSSLRDYLEGITSVPKDVVTRASETPLRIP